MSGRFDLLVRTGAWQLAAGEDLVLAPLFPIWLDVPGFRDEAHRLEYPRLPLCVVREGEWLAVLVNRREAARGRVGELIGVAL